MFQFTNQNRSRIQSTIFRFTPSFAFEPNIRKEQKTTNRPIASPSPPHLFHSFCNLLPNYKHKSKNCTQHSFSWICVYLKIIFLTCNKIAAAANCLFTQSPISSQLCVCKHIPGQERRRRRAAFGRASLVLHRDSGAPAKIYILLTLFYTLPASSIDLLVSHKLNTNLARCTVVWHVQGPRSLKISICPGQNNLFLWFSSATSEPNIKRARNPTFNRLIPWNIITLRSLYPHYLNRIIGKLIVI